MYNLSDIHGRKVLTGIDTDGNHWSQFEVDYIGMESKELDTCTECELELEYGWVNKDNPSIKVCDDEVQYQYWSGSRRYGAYFEPLFRRSS